MWSLQFLGMDMYVFIVCFMIYSFLGWAFESIVVSIDQKHWVNRGFVSGPFCPIYAVGAMFVIILLTPVKNNLVLLFLGGTVIATVVEYLVAVLLEKLFHATWWDYSHMRFQFQGRVCLRSSLAWGVLTVLVVRFLHPAVARAISAFPRTPGEFIMTLWLMAMTMDTGIMVYHVLKLNEKLQKLSEVRDELRLRLENTKLYESRKELLEHLEQLPISEVVAELLERMEEQKQELQEAGLEARLRSEYLKKEIRERFEYKVRLLEDSERVERRILQAFPGLRSKEFERELEDIKKQMKRITAKKKEERHEKK